MPETAAQNRTAVPVGPETAARTEPSRESSPPVYTTYEQALRRERDRLRDEVLAERATTGKAQTALGRAGAERKRLLQKVRELTETLEARSVLHLTERHACRAVVDLCIVAREQAERWCEPEPGTLQDMAGIALCYSEAATRSDARARLLGYLTKRYADTDADEETGLVWLTEFTGGVMSVLEDTAKALRAWIKFAESGSDERYHPLRGALTDDATNQNTGRLATIRDPEPHEWPGWLETLQDAVFRVLPTEIERLYALADEAGREIARERREAADEDASRRAAYAEAKRCG